jgi:hypothetical protein
MTVHIPSKKSEVLTRGNEHPALNVKHYGSVEYTTARITQEFGCTPETAKRAAEWCYDSAREEFWEQALDSLNFAMLGDKEASQYKPCGLKKGPFEIYAEGRSGGWLVATGLPEVATWPAATFQKWRKFARFCAQEMEYLASWEYGKDMIEANEWAPKADTGEAIRADVAAANPGGKLARAALAIHKELDGKEWDGANCLERIAAHLRAAGLAVREPADA